jgi:hypothetical protein
LAVDGPFADLAVCWQEHSWELVVQRLRAAESTNIHFEDDFLPAIDNNADEMIEIALRSLDMVTEIPRYGRSCVIVRAVRV